MILNCGVPWLDFIAPTAVQNHETVPVGSNFLIVRRIDITTPSLPS
jgi:hypothetical protein